MVRQGSTEGYRAVLTGQETDRLRSRWRSAYGAPAWRRATTSLVIAVTRAV
jgi:hypothetical protein